MFCPKCGGEYREGFIECADCRVPLTEQAPPEPEDLSEPDAPDLEFVHVLSTYNSADIAIIRTYLEAEGIRFFIEGEVFNALRPLVQPARLLVVKRDLAAAQEILADLHLRHTTHLVLGKDEGEEAAE